MRSREEKRKSVPTGSGSRFTACRSMSAVSVSTPARPLWMTSDRVCGPSGQLPVALGEREMCE